MPKRVSVYERSGTVYVVASHQTQAGFWVDDDEIITLVTPQPADIGNAVQVALARSREGIPTPPPSVDLSIPLLTVSGATSWGAFVKAARYVGIRQNGDAIKVTPYKNLGGSNGFGPLQDKVASLSDKLELAVAVTRALEVAKGA